MDLQHRHCQYRNGQHNLERLGKRSSMAVTSSAGESVSGSRFQTCFLCVCRVFRYISHGMCVPVLCPLPVHVDDISDALKETPPAPRRSDRVVDMLIELRAVHMWFEVNRVLAFRKSQFCSRYGCSKHTSASTPGDD
jgi:hypothetical protein